MKNNFRKVICTILCLSLCFSVGGFAGNTKSPELNYLESLLAASDDYKPTQLGQVFKELTMEYYKSSPREGRSERMAEAFREKGLDPVQAANYQNFIVKAQEIMKDPSLSTKQRRAKSMELASTLRVPQGNANMSPCDSGPIVAGIAAAGAIGFGIMAGLDKYADKTVITGSRFEEYLSIENSVPVVKQKVVNDTETITSSMDEVYMTVAVISGVVAFVSLLSTFGCGG